MCMYTYVYVRTYIHTYIHEHSISPEKSHLKNPLSIILNREMLVEIHELSYLPTSYRC